MPSAEAPVEHGRARRACRRSSSTPPTALGTTWPRKSDTDVTSPSTRWISSPGVWRRWNSWSRPSTWRVMRRRSSFVVPHAVTVAKPGDDDGDDLGGHGDGEERQRQADELGGAGARRRLGRRCARTTSGPASDSAELTAEERAEDGPTRASGRSRASRARPRDGESCRHRRQSPAAIARPATGFPPVRGRATARQYARRHGTDTATATLVPADEAPPTTTLVEEELLVEEISIDGMCGVY